MHEEKAKDMLDRMMKVSVVIPTLNAGLKIERLLDKLQKQSLTPHEIVVVDSESDDETCRLARQAGARVLEVQRKAFDHGGTRDMAFRQTTGDIVVFMTQDALPADAHFIEKLTAPFADSAVAAVGGRQVAFEDARPFEKAVRAHNYPDIERVWNAQDIAALGVRAFMISDVCAAYRREAYLDVGGFDHPVLTNEDMLMAEKLLHAGYKLAYTGKAQARHSHRFTLWQEFQRNYAIGQTMKRYESRFEYAGETGTGVRLVLDVMGDLVRGREFMECFCFAANCAARLLGNRLGRMKETRMIKRRNGANHEGA